jgi:hypothetical protein
VDKWCQLNCNPYKCEELEGVSIIHPIILWKRLWKEYNGIVESVTDNLFSVVQFVCLIL